MQYTFNDSTPQRPEGSRALDAPVVAFNLNESLSQIRSEQAYRSSDRNAITLFKSEYMRIVLISLHEGAEMKPHAPDEISSIQVIQGKLKFTLGTEQLELEEGKTIVVHERVPHSIKAETEAALLLTMTGKV